ncbi:MAG: putative transposase [Limisphaerales bacterium]
MANAMSQSLANVVIHTIFSTKNREPWLRDPNLRKETFAFLGGTAKTLNCQPIKIGGHIDHVHLLTTLSRTITIADFFKETKRISSNWAQERDSALADFHWQAGYGAFSVSESNTDKVIHYIENQDEHHKHISFQDEYRQFLKKHGVAFDEKYVWD